MLSTSGMCITYAGYHPEPAGELQKKAPYPTVLKYKEASNGLTSLGGGPTEIECGDIDSDGDIDLLSVGDHENPITPQEQGILIWFNEGNGNWKFWMDGTKLGYGGMAVGDVNNDGKMDIGFGIHHNDTPTGLGRKALNVGIGDGSGKKYTDWSDGLAEEGQDWGLFGTDFGDFNNDGWLDIGACAFGAGDGVHAYINNKDGSWKHTGISLGGNSNNEFEFGDINADGNLDLVASWEVGTVYLGDGKGGWTNADKGLPPFDLYHSGPSLGDVNNDGFLDLSIVDWMQNLLRVYLWEDSTKSWKNSSSGISTSGISDLGSTRLADLNNDGNIDLICGYSDGFGTWLGDGTGKWTVDANIPVPGIPSSIKVPGDIDHNGYPDIVAMYGYAK
jgi:hypothetical protein